MEENAHRHAKPGRPKKRQPAGGGTRFRAGFNQEEVVTLTLQETRAGGGGCAHP